ncbi:MAG: ATPase [Gammaproteobacteria bacterium]|nr:ATPase [Gammaproteobacteria bacterium]
MDESIYDLLKVEQEAEQIVLNGENEREVIRQKALDDANATIKQFNDRLPEMHQSFLDKAQERADQSIAELKLRYNERNQELRALAEEHEEEALNEAIKHLLKTEQ